LEEREWRVHLNQQAIHILNLMKKAVVNLMELDLNAECTLQKTWNMKGHPLVACSVVTTFITLPIFSASLH
jgi:hypothetical protein